jgi:hypothetical protein
VIDSGDTLVISGNTIFSMGTNDNSKGGVDTSKVEFWNYGHLDICGNADDKVEFKSAAANPDTNDWYGIRMIGSDCSATIQNCKVSDARYGIRSHRTITMRNVDVTNCFPCGVYLYEDSVSTNESTLDKCNISYNDSTDATGLWIWHCDSSAIVVDSCDINYNDRGIWVANSSPEITYSNMKHNKGDGLVIARYETQFKPDPTISWCKIENNEEDGVYFKMAEGYVEYTSIKNNDTRGIYCWHNLSRPYIYRSKITGNPTGIRTFYSDPKIGDTAKTDSTGYNTIDNEDYNLYNGYGMVPPPVIKAENCYWGQSPPDTTKFNRYVSGEENKIYVDYNPYLASDPVTYLARSADGTRIPTSVYLYQNFPNPLIGGRVTQIRYSLPRREKVTIRVYDVSGRRIRTLIDKVQQAGHHYVSWNGLNERGNEVAPGVYFYQMRVGAKIMSKKTVLLH